MKDLLIKTIFTYKRISRTIMKARVPLLVYTDCKFHPSCSDYAVEAINKYGIFKGPAKSLIRILRCSPFSRGGVDLP